MNTYGRKCIKSILEKAANMKWKFVTKELCLVTLAKNYSLISA